MKPLDASGMRKIFEAYNVTAKDLKPGRPEWKLAYIYRKGNLTSIYMGEYKEVFLHLKNKYWFNYPHRSKRALLVPFRPA